LPSLVTQVCTSLADYTAAIENMRVGTPSKLWFRGSGTAKHGLVPSLFRHPTIREITNLLNVERDIVSMFKLRSIPHLASRLDRNWDYLFLMRHHGVPTRLLDWSENPFVALYFAVEYPKKPTEDAAVWVFKPGVWNQHVLSYRGLSEHILDPYDSVLDPMEPASDIPDAQAKMFVNPAAIYGAYNSARIVAQRGGFTIAGTDLSPLEEQYCNSSCADSTLCKIIISKDHISSFREAVLSYGITASVIYPGLDGLARDLSWEFGYGSCS
jgi:FRG domain